MYPAAYRAPTIAPELLAGADEIVHGELRRPLLRLEGGEQIVLLVQQPAAAVAVGDHAETHRRLAGQRLDAGGDGEDILFELIDFIGHTAGGVDEK